MLFSWLVIAYLFLAGAGSGAFLIAAVCCMVDAAVLSAKTARLTAAVQPAFYLAPGIILAAILFLFFDLGAPERVVLLLLNPVQSIMSVGAWLVALLFAVSGMLAIASAGGRVPRGFQFACMAAGAVLAAGVMTYTGLLLSSLPSVPFWNTGWLPTLFVASSLSCGGAVIVFADAAIHPSPAGTSKGPWRLAGVLLAVEITVLTCYFLSRQLAGGEALTSVQQLLFGSLAAPFWVAVVGLGLAIPAILHITAGRRVPLRMARMAASAGVLAGGLALRYCIVAAALTSPLELTIIQII